MALRMENQVRRRTLPELQSEPESPSWLPTSLRGCGVPRLRIASAIQSTSFSRNHSHTEEGLCRKQHRNAATESSRACISLSPIWALNAHCFSWSASPPLALSIFSTRYWQAYSCSLAARYLVIGRRIPIQHS